jgi:DNA-binding response OmpR family regulator
LQRLIAFIGHRYAEFDGAASLAEAREKMRENLYQLVILDLGLPDGNGWDLLPELREHQPAAKIIVLSSSELNEAQKQQIEMAFVKNRESSQEFLDVIESFFTQPKGAPVTG